MLPLKNQISAVCKLYFTHQNRYLKPLDFSIEIPTSSSCLAAIARFACTQKIWWPLRSWLSTTLVSWKLGRRSWSSIFDNVWRGYLRAQSAHDRFVEWMTIASTVSVVLPILVTLLIQGTFSFQNNNFIQDNYLWSISEAPKTVLNVTLP